jgi:hypothetical protein
MNWRGRFPAYVIAAFLLTRQPQPAEGATISVAARGDFQAALTAAQPGDTILLEEGATFVGNFTLPQKAEAAYITIRGGSEGVTDGDRISPDAAHPFAKLRSPNAMPVLRTAPGAHHWRLMLVELDGSGDGDLIALGDGSQAQSSPAAVPHDLIVDRCYIHGDVVTGRKRCVALNSAATTISRSYIADCKARGQDAQAIAGWNGPGPYTIVNNYLEASGENVLFGGGDPAIPNLVPSDIAIVGNTVTKPPAWRMQPWQVKNLFELKNARRVRVSGNTFENNWQAAQSGFAILLTVRNQNGGCPWCEVSDVVFEHNLVRHSAAGISVLGVDNNAPSRQTRSIQIRNNVFTDIDGQRWGGNGYFLLVVGGPRDIAIDHNTIVQDHASGIVQIEGPQVPGFRFTNNLVRQNAYGMIGADHAPGNDSIHAYLPGAEITHNVIADGDSSKYPPGNTYPSTVQLKAQFASFEAADYRLVVTSPWRRGGTDGADLGADISQVPGGVPPGSGRKPAESRSISSE